MVGGAHYPAGRMGVISARLACVRLISFIEVPRPRELAVITSAVHRVRTYARGVPENGPRLDGLRRDCKIAVPQDAVSEELERVDTDLA